ncbi:MAG: hypothetical protein LQ351_006193 [Letrouitia transgressa]|nr:MAG: hypothetical protein LQ351_006193 [Letrouitia transgressa]
MSFPPPPASTIDWENIGFAVREGETLLRQSISARPHLPWESTTDTPIKTVNGHIESHYSVTTGQWTTPQFIADPYLRIHGMAPVLNYGQQAFEGIKAFRLPSDSRIAIFRPSQNASRMVHSVSYVSIPPVPEDLFLKCCRMAVALNAEFVPPHGSGAAMYIRPLVFGSAAQLGLSPPTDFTFVVYVMPTGVYHGLHPVDALILEQFDRAAPEGTGSAKVGGNYAPVMRWSDRARTEGFGITLHLDSQSRSCIDEFSTSGFVGIKKQQEGGEGKVTLVVPDSKCVIKSVTSDSVCEIARSMLGWKVECRPVPYEELPEFSEVLAAGTAAALVPVKSITMRSRKDRFVYQGESDNEPGPACVKLLKTLQGIQQGTVKDQFGWLDFVDAVEGVPGQQATKGVETNGVNGHVDGLV